MLKVDEIAKDLKVSRNTVVSLIKKGEIVAIKVGDQYRIPEESYKSYISLQTISRSDLIKEPINPITSRADFDNDNPKFALDGGKK